MYREGFRMGLGFRVRRVGFLGFRVQDVGFTESRVREYYPDT